MRPALFIDGDWKLNHDCTCWKNEDKIVIYHGAFGPEGRIEGDFFAEDFYGVLDIINR